METQRAVLLALRWVALRAVETAGRSVERWAVSKVVCSAATLVLHWVENLVVLMVGHSAV